MPSADTEFAIQQLFRHTQFILNKVICELARTVLGSVSNHRPLTNDSDVQAESLTLALGLPHELDGLIQTLACRACR